MPASCRVQSEFLAAYVLELSLPEYSALAWLPSVTAAAAVLLARYTCAANVPVLRGLLAWNPTLEHYCGYRCGLRIHPRCIGVLCDEPCARGT